MGLTRRVLCRGVAAKKPKTLPKLSKTKKVAIVTSNPPERFAAMKAEAIAKGEWSPRNRNYADCSALPLK
jgi:hypothetical protein